MVFVRVIKSIWISEFDVRVIGKRYLHHGVVVAAAAPGQVIIDLRFAVVIFGGSYEDHFVSILKTKTFYSLKKNSQGQKKFFEVRLFLVNAKCELTNWKCPRQMNSELLFHIAIYFFKAIFIVHVRKIIQITTILWYFYVLQLVF